MNDLISRKALLAEYDRVHIGEPGKARKMIEDAPAVREWIPVSERLPKSGVHVLVCCEVVFGSGRYVCDGYFADRYTEKALDHGEDIACEYCEDDDEYYLWQGWYEVIKNWDDYNSIVIGDVVTHWMPLPEPTKEEE